MKEVPDIPGAIQIESLHDFLWCISPGSITVTIPTRQNRFDPEARGLYLERVDNILSVLHKPHDTNIYEISYRATVVLIGPGRGSQKVLLEEMKTTEQDFIEFNIYVLESPAAITDLISVSSAIRNAKGLRNFIADVS